MRLAMIFLLLVAVVYGGLSSCARHEVRHEVRYEPVSSLKTVESPADSLREPMGVAVAADGAVYVADARRAEVIKYAADGSFLAAWSRTSDHSAKLSRPIDLAVAPNGTLYVVDFDLDRVFTFTGDGAPIAAWGGPGTEAGQFTSPSGIDISTDGTVYVADFQNHRVQAFRPDGAFLESIGSEGHGAGELYYPTDVTLVGDSLYVSDAYNNRIAVFTRNGEWKPGEHLWRGGLEVPVSAAVTVDGMVHVSDSENRRVVAYGPDGMIRGEFALPVGRGTGLNTPAHLGVAPGGILYIADPGDAQVLVVRYTTVVPQ